jgi:hypothetical protein
VLLDHTMGGRVRHDPGMHDKDVRDKGNKLKKNPHNRWFFESKLSLVRYIRSRSDQICLT